MEVVDIEQYTTINSATSRILLYSDRKGISVTAPILNGSREFSTQEKRINDIYLTTFHNILFKGNSDVLVDLDKKLVISDFCHNMDESIYFIDGLLQRTKNNRCILNNNFSSTPKEIDCGIMISGKFSNNFYHCLYENINRILAVNINNVPAEVPFIIDEATYSIKTLSEAIDYLNVDRRKIILIKPTDIYVCKLLYYIDHLHYIVPHHKLGVNCNSSTSFFDGDFLKRQERSLLAHCSASNFPKRVFLTRKSTLNRNFNENELWPILEKYEFASIDPATLSFADQITLFSGADFIVGGSGAAFSNILFCKKSCKIICFRSIIACEGPSTFKVLASVNDCSFWNYNPSSKAKSSIHSDYYIDPVQFEKDLIFILNDKIHE